MPAPVAWLPDGTLRLVDQTLLPARLEYIACHSVEELAGAIRTLKVRGAPALGVAAAYGLCLAAASSRASDLLTFLSDIESAASLLRSTRPTAVNLGWALDTVLSAARGASDMQGARAAILATAQRIEHENEEANKRMGEHGAQLLHDGMNVLTHCNAGPLAAGGIGSALGIIYTARRQGKRIHVWVDETRPLLQGARLTTWELSRWGVPCTLIADSMAASLMRAGRVDAVLVGADRIAANGDVANKIGTYGLATLAHAHDIPFYVAAPTSTIDLNIRTGDDIKIEERHPDEVTYHGGKRLAPDSIAVYNPAFDVTPNRLVSCIITESGILRQPYSASLQEI
ncbi:MAG TPA: S-methyl-5-thioribose-1-phosphate isomerase [Chloroflexia bacterium]|nr:S-methyl-5-thioribose-1-phosphate isomerase [Chloroflexia bacterium]